MVDEADYWDSVAEKTKYVNNPFFAHKKRELEKLVSKWLTNAKGRVLKTDLFQEAFSFDYILFSGSKVTGIDISPKIVWAASKRVRGERFVISDVREMCFKDDSFDIVFSNSTLDHFPEVDKAMSEIFRVLKPNGKAIITIENKTNPMLYILNKIMKKTLSKPFYTEDCYSIFDMKKRMRRIGFRVEKTGAIIHIPPLVPTLLNMIYKNRTHRVLGPFLCGVIRFLEFVGDLETPLNYITGYLVAVMGVKK